MAGDTLPLSLAPSALPLPQGRGRGRVASAWTLALGLRRGTRPQEGREEGSRGCVLLSSRVGICSHYSRTVHS